MKTKLLTMKVPVELKDRFTDLCKINDSSVSREIRMFMRRYVLESEKKCSS